MILSIIIPVYNTEKYVEKCIFSCVNQDLPKDEYEIIVVNDGTKDNSMTIVKRLAKCYSQIQIVSQENAGLSAARNNGINIARGKYIWFVDSDDWIEDNCLKRIVNRLENNVLDGLVHSGIRYIDDEHVLYIKENFPDQILTGREYMSQRLINCAAVKTIYNTEFLRANNLYFFEGIYHEDAEFSPRAYYYIHRLGFTNEHYYYNRLTPGSITQKPNPQKAFDLMTVSQRLYDFKKSHEMKDVGYAFDNLIASDLNQALGNTKYMEKEVKKELGRLIKDSKHLLRCYNHSKSLKYKIEGFLFVLFPSKVVILYDLLSKHKV